MARRPAKLGECCIFSTLVAVVGNNHQFVVATTPKELQRLVSELKPFEFVVAFIGAIGKQQVKKVILVQATKEKFQIVKVVCEGIPVHHN